MSFETSEQHKALQSRRMKRDYTDAKMILRFLTEGNPFENCIHLMNIEVAGNSVKVDDAKMIGTTIIKKMAEQSLFGYSYKRKDIVANMITKTVECEGEPMRINNQLLFQRLSAIVGRDQVELVYVLSGTVNLLPFSTKEA